MNPVTFPLKQATTGPAVADLHAALKFLGYSIAAADLANQRYGNTTKAAVKKFQTEQQLTASGEVDEPTAARLNQALTERGALEASPGTTQPPVVTPDPPPPQPQGRQVRGTVRHADGTALADFRVRAFHRRLGGEDVLGEAKSDDRGQYLIPYELPAGWSAVDLFVRAYEDGQAVVATSTILIGAAPQGQLDLTVEAERFRGPSEFAAATAALAGKTAGIDLGGLTADDVALLVLQTGVSRISVTAWIASRRLADRYGIDHESLYALVRRENTASMPRILRRSPTRLTRALADAGTANLVSHAAGERAGATVARLREVAIELSAATDTPGSIGALLARGGKTSPEHQRRFIERYAHHEGAIQDFWAGLRKDPAFGDAAVDDLQLTLQLGTLTANHPPLVAALRSRGITRASETSALTADDWRALVQGEVDGQPVGVPDSIAGATEAGRLDNYLILLNERVTRAFPTAHAAKALKALPDWRSSPAVAFLEANPDFNLHKANLKQALSSGDVVIRPDWDRAKLETDLAATQRVMRVAPRGREEAVVGGLLDQGYTSAFAISRASRSTFVRRTAASLGDETLADAVYRKAQFQSSRTVSAYGLMHPAIGFGLIESIGGKSTGAATDATWAALFGDTDYCTCEHCRSIYSPAAYLVDLLAWLDGHDVSATAPDPTASVFDLLDRRRPDIKAIELSCENTNTVLPYVDLVNEILEVRIFDPKGTGSEAVPAATTATSPELLANPEYLNAEAYDGHLAKAVFPHLLPFDLWGELGRVYFEHLGVRRSDLMEALRRGNVPSAGNINAERLALSPAQWGILTGATRRKVWEYWGYASSKPEGTDFKIDLAIVSNFLRRARIQYDDLLDMLHSRFVNPSGIAIIGSECNTDEMTLSPLKDAALGRMHRFLRLWRNRGWTLLDLDKVLHAMDMDKLSAPELGRLADLDRVLALTRAPLLDVLCWWSAMDTYQDRPEKPKPVKCLYDRVFLNRAVDAAAEDPDFAFALKSTRTALANTVTWDEARSLLQAALAIDSDDLSLMIDETVDGTAEGLPNEQRVVIGADATLEGLSALYRHVSLARALKLGVAELLGLLRLTGIDPFDPGHTGDTVDFIETVADIRKAGLSLDDLHYLLEHDADAETRVGVTDEAIGQTLVELRDGLARIDTDFAVGLDPTGEITARFLAMLLDADAGAEVMAALLTPAEGANNAELAAVVAEHLGSFVGIDEDRLIAEPAERRFERLVAELGPFLRDMQGEALIIEKAATFSGRNPDSVEDLLDLRIDMTVGGRNVGALLGLLDQDSLYRATTATEILEADDPEAFAALRRLAKAATVLSGLEMDMDEQLWLFDVGIRHGLLDPAALPIEPRASAAGTWAAWTRLVELFALRKDLPGGEPSLVELLEWLDSDEDPAVAEETFRTELAARTGWLRADLDTLVGAFGLAFPNDWRDGAALRKLADAFRLIGRMGASAAQADGWATATIGAAQAEELRLAAKSKHDEERWPAIARGLRDPVREQQRAALVGYLLAEEAKKAERENRAAAYVDEDDLYADLLIDVEMAPCMLTSRIKLALSSVQLIVQRGFLNLEAGVEFTRDDRDQWEWMKNYRVWEAARKVFLYPENWIEPELRLNKSFLFENLENALLQGEITDASVEKAYTEYLEGLLKIARLEVMGLYHEYENDEDGTVDVLHVVARTKGHPQEYYYRQWLDAREWTPWEKLDVDIEGNHVILAVHDRRLFLFWPVVIQKAEGDETSTTDFFEMKLAWIERMNGQWGGRKLSEDFLTISGKWDALDASQLTSSEVASAGEQLTYFRLADEKALTIECRQAQLSSETAELLSSVAPPTPDLLGSFVLDTCSGSMVVDDTQDTDAELVVSINQSISRMRLLTWGWLGSPTYLALMTGPTDPLSKRLDGEAESVTVLGEAVSGSTLAYPHQYGDFVSQQCAFFDDDEHTLQIIPETSVDWEQMAGVDTIDPGLVGVLVSEQEVFHPPAMTAVFDPEILWDQASTVVFKANQTSTAAAPGVTESRAVVATTADMAAAAQSLNTAALQQSQYRLDEVLVQKESLSLPQDVQYRFALFYHPYVCDFMKELRRLGVAGLLDPNPDGPAGDLARQEIVEEFFEDYEPTDEVEKDYPVRDIDFDFGGAYAEYNWEIFFHAPMLIACRLMQNQRFEEARRWFHFIFDPTNRSDDADPLRFWKIKPFYRDPDAPITEFLALAASGDDSAEAERQEYDQQVDAWLEDPFNPHAIARLRTTAYQKALVMKYLDNLIAWGDQLFRRDSIESLNEATQLYVLALDLLGERPDALPPRTEAVPTTFEKVRSALAETALNNPLVELENAAFEPAVIGTSVSTITLVANSLNNLIFRVPGLPGGTNTTASFYFCIPPNDKLLSYWDILEDRLFKLRHCMNIEGVVRQLPLFEPPIDPGMLVRARAGGVDLASALADLNAPLPYYRFAVMLQKTYALNQSVRALGDALLGALEKQDAEALTLLRSRQEVAVLEAVRGVKKLAIEEARHSLTAAERSLDVVEQRKAYFDGLVKTGLLDEERKQQKNQNRTRDFQSAASILTGIGSAMTPIPAVTTGAAGSMGTPVGVATVTDGQKLAKGLELLAQGLTITGAYFSGTAASQGLSAGFKRRKEEWKQQADLADREIKQINKQIEAAEVRLTMAERDLENHERQMENARSVREFMEHKFTSVELYQWMVGQLSSLYFQSYQLAYDLAKQTERAYRHELALPEASFIQFGYWDSLKKGLLAGWRLQYDLERMDAAYLENNRREYELVRHVSLAMLDPLALLKLQTEGECEFSIPEALFDIDFPGQYLRRIKSLSVSVPCVTGPYTSMPLRLTQVSSRTRADPTAAGDYPYDPAGDARFQVHTGAIQSIAISGGREDAGLFAPDHRDERYLPFEGTGAVSDWNLKFTSAVPTFDWLSVTDVVLHLRYTAREGGDLLRDAALASLQAEMNLIPLQKAFSARREFTTPWSAFLLPAADATDAVLALDLGENRFPYLAQGAGLSITKLSLVAVVKEPADWQATDVELVAAGESQTAVLIAAPDFGDHPYAEFQFGAGISPGLFELRLPLSGLSAPSDWIADLVVVATYQFEL
jgi:hypothetical protein